MVAGSNPAVPINYEGVVVVERVWLKHYPKNVPAEINPDRYSSLAEIIEESCKQYANLPAYYNFGSTLSYQQVEMLSRAFAAYLQQELKLKKGDRIAVMLPNMLQYPIAVFGALRAGIIVVNVNPMYTLPEFVHQLNDSGAETILVLANFANLVEKALPKTNKLKNIIVTEMGDMLSPLKSFLVNFYLRYIKRKIPRLTIPNIILFNDVLSTGKKLNFNRLSLCHYDIAFLQYTGGTTGIAKGAMLTHGNLVANVLQVEVWLQNLMIPGSETVITALPLYHIFSLTGNCFLVLKVGGFNVLITNPRDLRQMVSEISKFKFSVMTGVNTLFNVLLQNKTFRKFDFSKLKLSLGGGSAIQKVVADKWQELTNCVLLEAYGLTEASPGVSINPTHLKSFNGTAGLPLPSTQVCVFDDKGQALPINQPGELGVKGPQVMLGYWNNESETEKVFNQDKWLLTGDIAIINEDGFVKIVDRKKDMIKVSGFNVYPNEIEAALVTIPGVKEAAVIGVPDERMGEAVKAFIVKNDTGLTEQEIINHAHSILTGYKIPRYIVFLNELPKTNVGKVLRRKLMQY